VGAFHNNPDMKAALLTRIRAHRAADWRLLDPYDETDRSSVVSCSVHEPDASAICQVVGSGHANFEQLFDIPEQLAYLEDRLFGCLERRDADAWPERFIEAVQIGSDLSGVWDRFCLWVLTDRDFGVLQFAGDADATLQTVSGLYQRAVDGNEPSRREWVKVGRDTDALWVSLLTETTWTTDVESTASVWAIRAAYELILARKDSGTSTSWVLLALSSAWVSWSAAPAPRSDGRGWGTAAADHLIFLLEAAPTRSADAFA